MHLALKEKAYKEEKKVLREMCVVCEVIALQLRTMALNREMQMFRLTKWKALQ
jgi:hypothetical protein